MTASLFAPALSSINFLVAGPTLHPSFPPPPLAAFLSCSLPSSLPSSPPPPHLIFICPSLPAAPASFLVSLSPLRPRASPPFRHFRQPPALPTPPTSWFRRLGCVVPGCFVATWALLPQWKTFTTPRVGAARLLSLGTLLWSLLARIYVGGRCTCWVIRPLTSSPLLLYAQLFRPMCLALCPHLPLQPLVSSFAQHPTTTRTACQRALTCLRCCTPMQL